MHTAEHASGRLKPSNPDTVTVRDPHLHNLPAYLAVVRGHDHESARTAFGWTACPTPALLVDAPASWPGLTLVRETGAGRPETEEVTADHARLWLAGGAYAELDRAAGRALVDVRPGRPTARWCTRTWPRSH